MFVQRLGVRRAVLCALGPALIASQLATETHAQPTRPSPATGALDEAPPNLLVLLADDLGVDMLPAYGLGEDLPTLPTLDALVAGGLRFDNMWAYSECSPTRATILTGRYGFRTGIGDIVQGGAELSPAEFLLPELLDAGAPVPYAHGYFGKWHLTNNIVSGMSTPNAAGWDHFQGVIANLYPPHVSNPPLYGYGFFEEVTNGVATEVMEYATTRQVDSFLDWSQQQTQPWLACVAFSAPHAPFHAPPEELYTVPLPDFGTPEQFPREHYKAMIEALDSEVGRLLASLGPALDNTIVFFLGDNGTPSPLAVPPFDPFKAKLTLYEGGVRVPLIVSGPGVAAGASSAALVSSTDLYVTLAELANVDLAASLPAGLTLDGVSFLPQLSAPELASARDTVFAESFTPNGHGLKVSWKRAIRGKRYKYLTRSDGSTEFYDLLQDPFEERNLLEMALSLDEQRQLRKLWSQLEALTGSE